MTFNHINRRTHLYLAMFLLPWFLVYALSSIPFTRNFNAFFDDGQSPWTLRFERAYQRPIPDAADEAALRQIGAQILQDADLEGAFGVHRPNKRRLNIYLFDFWNATRLTYNIEGGRLKAEDRRFRIDHFFTGLHARGGYMQDAFLNDAWAFLVDIVCIGILIWIASGIVMWWQLKPTRLWGTLALAGGILSFTIFLLAL